MTHTNITHDKDKKPLITISVPVFNEEKNIKRLIERLQAFSDIEKQYHFEFLFTDNASTDRTFEILAEYSINDPRIRVMRFSRNFGFQKSILTNFLHARGEAAIQIDADLQDPPELISDFLRKWEQGYKVVYGIRKHRKEFFLISISRKLYYRLITFLSETYVPPDAGDFRLISRNIIEHLRTIREQTPYLRGIISNLGFPQIGIPYDRERRIAGTSKFGLFNLIDLAIDGITSQSIKPLRLITLFGFGICLISFFVSIAYLMIALFNDTSIAPGFTTLVILVLVSIGINSFFLGLIGEYIGRVFNNTRGLPISIIQDQIDHKTE